MLRLKHERATHFWWPCTRGFRRAAISPSIATRCLSCGRYGEIPLQGAFDAALCGPPPDVDVEPLVMRREARYVLTEVAHQDNDLLVIGTGRRGARRRMLRTRIPRYCAAHAVCPVLVVPPTAFPQGMDHPLHAWLIVDRALTPGK
jgi:hypothetical protein